MSLQSATTDEIDQLFTTIKATIYSAAQGAESTANLVQTFYSQMKSALAPVGCALS